MGALALNQVLASHENEASANSFERADEQLIGLVKEHKREENQHHRVAAQRRGAAHGATRWAVTRRRKPAMSRFHLVL